MACERRRDRGQPAQREPGLPLLTVAGRGAWGLGALLLLAPVAGWAQSLTRDEALRLAFPAPAELVRQTAFLSAAEQAAVAEAAGPGIAPPPAVVTWYEARQGGAVVGAAYFDMHRVRTLPEVLMITVTPAGTVGRVEVLRFDEPPDYRAPGGWLAQLAGQRLGPGLSLRADIVPMTGATLTARAAVEATRRTLALHGLLARRAAR